ncbi:hypothetical protein CEXT_432781 [Caerostris extrusa]|uniref:Uncharacterized protein n=1 Tax=Caerostris extrusa TaxID=172846 RepID=A0AAV4WVT4_CAEEX|nr:hypothetical protein CEXT_432781 [Caerostris extrusa]
MRGMTLNRAAILAASPTESISDSIINPPSENGHSSVLCAEKGVASAEKCSIDQSRQSLLQKHSKLDPTTLFGSCL